MSKRFTITCQEEVKKHLGVTYDWGEDEHGLYAKASMKELEEDIVTCLEEIIGKELKRWPTPGYPGTTLVKGDHVEAVKPEGYQKVVGKTMFWNQKVGVECNNATRELSRYMSHPGDHHWKALERLGGYIKHIPFDCLIYRAPKVLRSVCYFDSNFAQNPDDRISVSGIYETLDDAGVVYTTSQGQGTVAQSTTESEYRSGGKAGQGIVFTTNLVDEMLGEDSMKRPGLLVGDNSGSLFLMNNLSVGQRTKHIDIKAHWIRQILKEKYVKTRSIPSKFMPADIDTKNTDEATFLRHARKKRGVDNVSIDSMPSKRA